MPKQKLFDDESEDEVELKTENEYAKKYDTWRGKEEIHKLEQKYGASALEPGPSPSSDSEEESDDEPPELSEEAETQFLKTLALLKKKDPRIYDPQFSFFEEKEKEEVKQSKEKTVTFADSDEEEDESNIFSIEKKAEVDKKQTSTAKSGKGEVKAYLTGEAAHMDPAAERDLAPLRALWTDPALDDGEAFLRDYILNQKYRGDGRTEADGAEGAGGRLRDDAALEEDALLVEGQDQFERAFNFRFEEPDHEYLKRFPRTMSYIRPKDDRRATRRTETRARKDREKTTKMEEIARLKALKLREIQEKIARIKEVTGNQELAFEEQDIEGDFDPAAHDRRMRAVFDEQYYAGDADTHKPVFPDIDLELEIENWDNYEAEVGEAEEEVREAQDFAADAHCEDQDFNMDADYDPSTARANLLEQMKQSLGKKRRNRKNKSKLAKILSTVKPKYLPQQDETYDKYMEEYYKMDCEDVIGGDLPTRFKYREVVPNDYGLTVEEILLADDKELTQWVPLKKIIRHKPDTEQRNEVHSYRQKAADRALKTRVLPSLFKNLPQEPELVVSAEENTKKKKKKKKNKQKESKTESTDVVENGNENEPSVVENSGQNGDADASATEKEIKKNKRKSNVVNKDGDNNQSGTITTVTDNINTTNYSTVTENVSKISRRQKKNKKKKAMVVENVENATPSRDSHVEKAKKRKISASDTQVPNKKTKQNKNDKTLNNTNEGKSKDNVGKSNKKKKDKNNKDKSKNKDNSKNKQNDENPMTSLSDERLKAYGLNPKKYRGFLKYKKF